MRNHAPHSVSENAGKVCHDVGRVAASELHIRREAKIFAYQHPISNAHRSGELLNVAIPKTEDDLAVAALNVRAAKSEAAEVVLTAASESVFFADDFKTSPTDSFAGKVGKR
jgi:hypothetical protein